MSREGIRPSGPVEGALEILEAVARFGAGVSAKEIATVVRMAPATSYRLLNTLVACEYLVRVADLKGFALGRRTDGIVNAAIQPFVPAAARDVIDQLRSQVRFGVHLVVYVASTLRVADADPDRPLHSEHDLHRYPHASAAGKLLLAHLPEWREALPQLTRLTGRTITDPERLEGCLEEIRRDKTARQAGEFADDLSCLAVPVCSQTTDVVGAICLAGPVNRAAALDDHLHEIRAAANKLTRLIS